MEGSHHSPVEKCRQTARGHLLLPTCQPHILCCQGLHQGADFSPLLFLLYIVELCRFVPENVEVDMFADDVSLFSSHPNQKIAEAAIQEIITNVAE